MLCWMNTSVDVDPWKLLRWPKAALTVCPCPALVIGHGSCRFWTAIDCRDDSDSNCFLVERNAPVSFNSKVCLKAAVLEVLPCLALLTACVLVV